MKITALLENTTERADMQIEHGLSLYIQTQRHNILFDMGQTDLFYTNAKTLGIDLAKVDFAVLSHGHYDHGGGLLKFLEINDHAKVYLHKDAFLPHYNGSEKYIGLDASLLSHPRLVFTEDSQTIDEGVQLFSCNDKPRRTGTILSGLTEKVGDTFIADDFRHEHYLLLSEQGKKVLISGCSHKGILDITKWFSPDLLVGGFHFSKYPLGEELQAAAKELASYPTEFYTCHCTGKAQFDFMRAYMPKLQYISCGQTLET